MRRRDNRDFAVSFPLLEGFDFEFAVALSKPKPLVLAWNQWWVPCSGPTPHLFGLGDHDFSCKLSPWPSSFTAGSAERRGAHSKPRSCRPQDDSSYPAYEPVRHASSASSASRTCEPPACVPPSLWPPHDVSCWPSDGTVGVNPHRHEPRSALPESAAGRIKLLPCLLILPSRRRSPLESSVGFNPR